MPTLEHPVFQISGPLHFSPSCGRRVRAALFTAAPAFRRCKSRVEVMALHSYAHGALSARITALRELRRTSSWSRA